MLAVAVVLFFPALGAGTLFGQPVVGLVAPTILHWLIPPASPCLTVLPPSGARERPLEPLVGEVKKKPEKPPEPAIKPTKIITSPVRGGQQIYAQGGDLVVISSVSPGAELLADGNIHVYGPMRGRALAGIKGDTKARIFCQQLTAELVSIAGQYKVSEDLRRDPLWGAGVQVSLSGDVLNIIRL